MIFLIDNMLKHLAVELKKRGVGCLTINEAMFDLEYNVSVSDINIAKYLKAQKGNVIFVTADRQFAAWLQIAEVPVVLTDDVLIDYLIEFVNANKSRG